MISSTEYLTKDISLFNGSFATTPHDTITLGTFFDYIKNPNDVVRTYRHLVSKYGKKSFKAEYLKKSLKCVTPSGVFSKRTDDSLISNFTNVIVLDVDRKGNESVDLDMAVYESRFMESTLAYHKSVSGDGYAIYVVVNDWNENTYRYAMYHYSVMLDITLDKATSNISRLRYISHDSDIYISDSVTPLDIPKPIKPKHKSTYVDTVERVSNDSIVYELIDAVISNGDDPTENYDDWFTLGCSIANWLGESGRSLFHKVSSNYYAYDSNEVDKKYDNILSINNYKASKGSIVYILSKYQ